MIQGVYLRASIPGSSVWLDLSPTLSTYSLGKTVSYDADFVTMDGELIRIGKRERNILTFTLFPGTMQEIQQYYNTLRGKDGKVTLSYSDPMTSTFAVEDFFLDSDPFGEYALYSVDNKARYKIGEFVFRSVRAQTAA